MPQFTRIEVVEAIRWDGTQACFDAHFAHHGYVMWLTRNDDGTPATDSNGHLYLTVETSRGTQMAYPGDWVIMHAPSGYGVATGDVVANCFKA